MAFNLLNKENFSVCYSDRNIPNESLVELFNGKRAALVVRNYIDDDCCNTISANFYEYEKSRSLNDIVPGNYVGAYHYDKSIEQYFNDVKNSEKEIQFLFTNIANPVLKLQEILIQTLKEYGFSFRVAYYKNKAAGRIIARKWTDNGSFSLKPHDDVAQLMQKSQVGFEIQSVSNFNVVGVNICVDISGQNDDGELILWNCIPDNEERKRLGIEETGYPYPLDFLVNFETLKIKIQKGDLYFVNSNLIHAVGNQQNNKRLTVSFLSGKINEETIIYWT